MIIYFNVAFKKKKTAYIRYYQKLTYCSYTPAFDYIILVYKPQLSCSKIGIVDDQSPIYIFVEKIMSIFKRSSSGIWNGRMDKFGSDENTDRKRKSKLERANNRKIPWSKITGAEMSIVDKLND